MASTNQIGFLLTHLAFLLMRQNDQVLQERLGIGFSQFKILKVLEARPHIQQKQVAAALGQTEASISRQIKLLHEQGLLQTTKAADNRRQHITTLTPKGVSLATEAIEVLNQHHQPLFKQLTVDQQQQLLSILQIMHDHACAADPTSACQQFSRK